MTPVICSQKSPLHQCFSPCSSSQERDRLYVPFPLLAWAPSAYFCSNLNEFRKRKGVASALHLHSFCAFAVAWDTPCLLLAWISRNSSFARGAGKAPSSRSTLSIQFQPCTTAGTSQKEREEMALTKIDKYSSTSNVLWAKLLHCLLLWLYLQVGNEGWEARWWARPVQNVPYSWQAVAKTHIWELAKKGSKHCCVIASTAARTCSWIKLFLSVGRPKRICADTRAHLLTAC